MAKKRHHDGRVKMARATEMYSGYEMRKHQEREAGSMISEDHNAIANLPQNVMIKEYPRVEFERYHLNDTIAVADNQMRDDVRGGKNKSSKEFPEKY